MISKVEMIEEEIKMLEEWYIGELMRISKELKAATKSCDSGMRRFSHEH
jgi:hypothetical protein